MMQNTKENLPQSQITNQSLNNKSNLNQVATQVMANSIQVKKELGRLVLQKSQK
jgi:hypothetical protein